MNWHLDFQIPHAQAAKTALKVKSPMFNSLLQQEFKKKNKIIVKDKHLGPYKI